MLVKRWHRPSAAVATGLATIAVLAACSSGADARSGTASAVPSVSATFVSLPPQAAHIHGLAINGTRTLLATHGGMWQLDGSAISRIGDTDVDFMGFTVATPGHFYSSGHPNSGDQFAQPVGLIESKDNGVTWEYLSRGGESDFHALSASGSAIYGYDGELRYSSDGKAWQTRNTSVKPFALAVDPTTADTVLATTQQGLRRSVDGGKNFAVAPQAPIVQLLSWTERTALWGVGPEGTVYVSQDAGATWTKRGSVNGPPSAIVGTGTNQLRVATERGVYASIDGGRTFTQIAGM